jgi:hypothetical protein
LSGEPSKGRASRANPRLTGPNITNFIIIVLLLQKGVKIFIEKLNYFNDALFFGSVQAKNRVIILSTLLNYSKKIRLL